MWVVTVKKVKGDFRAGFFPRKTYYKRDAKTLAQEARDKGCEGVEIKKEEKYMKVKVTQDVVNRSLDSAVENGYQLDDWAEDDIASDLGTYDADLEGVSVAILRPFVQEWKAQRLRDGYPQGDASAGVSLTEEQVRAGMPKEGDAK